MPKVSAQPLKTSQRPAKLRTQKRLNKNKGAS